MQHALNKLMFLREIKGRCEVSPLQPQTTNIPRTVNVITAPRNFAPRDVSLKLTIDVFVSWHIVKKSFWHGYKVAIVIRILKKECKFTRKPVTSLKFLRNFGAVHANERRTANASRLIFVWPTEPTNTRSLSRSWWIIWPIISDVNMPPSIVTKNHSHNHVSINERTIIKNINDREHPSAVCVKMLAFLLVDGENPVRSRAKRVADAWHATRNRTSVHWLGKLTLAVREAGVCRHNMRPN